MNLFRNLKNFTNNKSLNQNKNAYEKYFNILIKIFKFNLFIFALN